MHVMINDVTSGSCCKHVRFYMRLNISQYWNVMLNLFNCKIIKFYIPNKNYNTYTILLTNDFYDQFTILTPNGVVPIHCNFNYDITGRRTNW